jgi:hypothetical protein
MKNCIIVGLKPKKLNIPIKYNKKKLIFVRKNLHLLALVLPPKAERSPTDVFWHPIALTDRLVRFIFGARALDQMIQELIAKPLLVW